MKKALVIGVIVLFIGVSFTPTIGISNNDDTTPPVTTISFDPPEPDGKNGWYISEVTVTLESTDDLSGVKEIKYQINHGPVETIPGNNGTFILHEDGNDILIGYWAIDNAGNIEDEKSSYLDIDQTEPTLTLTYEAIDGDEYTGWDFEYQATAIDYCSGMERVEFYVYGMLIETFYGPGPLYRWVLHQPFSCSVLGIICNKEITKENVSFYSIMTVITMNWGPIDIGGYAYDNSGNIAIWKLETRLPDEYNICLFQKLTYPKDYFGFIGRNFIFAIFNIGDIG